MAGLVGRRIMAAWDSCKIALEFCKLAKQSSRNNFYYDCQEETATYKRSRSATEQILIASTPSGTFDSSKSML